MTLAMSDQPGPTSLAKRSTTISTRGHPLKLLNNNMLANTSRERVLLRFCTFAFLLIGSAAFAQGAPSTGDSFFTTRSAYIAAGCCIGGGGVFFIRLQGAAARYSLSRKIWLALGAGVGALAAFWATKISTGNDNGAGLAALLAAWAGAEAAMKKDGGISSASWVSPKDTEPTGPERKDKP